jgi:hypothetical protein
VLVCTSSQLHLEIIHQEEAITEREKTYELQMEGLRDDIKKLQFINGQKTQQYAQKVRTGLAIRVGSAVFVLTDPDVRQEREVTKLQAQLERLMAIGAPTGDPFRASVIEVKGPELPPSPRRSSLPSSPRRENEQQDRSTRMIEDLQDKITALTADNRQLQARCSDLVEKIKKREEEIVRLGKVAVGSIDSSDDAAARKMRELEKRLDAEAREDSSSIQIEQLTTQVDFLTEQVARYEERLKDASQQIQRNSSLSERLRWVHAWCRIFEYECRRSLLVV